MDEKGRALKGRLDFCERNVKALQNGVKGLIKNHQDGCQSTLDLSQRVRDTAAQEQFIDLQEDLIAISECTKRLAEERRRIMCERAEEKVLSTFQFIQERVLQPTKLLLKDRERALAKYEAMHRKLGGSGDGERPLLGVGLGLGLGRATREGEEALRQQRVSNYWQSVKNTDEMVDSNFRCFEKNRVVELKGMLEEVLRAEMLYHCRAIEILEPLCVSMRRLDPDRAMESITRELVELNEKGDEKEERRRRLQRRS